MPKTTGDLLIDAAFCAKSAYLSGEDLRPGDLMLERVNDLREVDIRTDEERFDGSGFPSKPAGIFIGGDLGDTFCFL